MRWLNWKLACDRLSQNTQREKADLRLTKNGKTMGIIYYHMPMMSISVFF